MQIFTWTNLIANKQKQFSGEKKKQTTHDYDGDYLTYSLCVRARACVFEI